MKLLRTCKIKDLPKEYKDLILNNFSTLYKVNLERGEIPQEVFNDLGFPMDTNYAAKEVVRDAKITNEMQQRAKVLSHKLQRQLRSAMDNQAKENK